MGNKEMKSMIGFSMEDKELTRVSWVHDDIVMEFKESREDWKATSSCPVCEAEKEKAKEENLRVLDYRNMVRGVE